MNLLQEPVVTIQGTDGIQAHGQQDSMLKTSRVSLPELLAAMTRDEVRSFPTLRPHQRTAWHMFLVQLSALAAWKAEYKELPENADSWRQALRTLTEDYANDEPWKLVEVDDTQPAFLQAPVPRENLKWSAVATPDALDMLITSRNHDLKQNAARCSEPEHWVFALVSLQTSEGYGGRGNQGIARMNGGSSSRPMLGIVPSRKGHISINPSSWWKRDVQRLIDQRMTQGNHSIGTIGGPALLWQFDWQEGAQLDLRDLDPWFIEVCRRIRLVKKEGVISASRSTSRDARIDAKIYKGNIGDPWAPVHKTEGKSLTLSGSGYSYRKLCDLLFGDWKRPLLATIHDGEREDMLLIAEGISRGNVKTEGFHSRTIKLPREPRLFTSASAADLSKAQMDEIEKFDKILRAALSLVAAKGDWNMRERKHFELTLPARRRFDRTADQLFFPRLWKRVEAAEENDVNAREAEKRAFLLDLRKAAKSIFEASLSAIPCPSMQRPRAEARARRIFCGMIRENFPELNERKNVDAVE